MFLANNYEHRVPGEMFCYTAQFPDIVDTSDQSQDSFYEFKDTIDPDTLYLHEAMKTHDWPKFCISMQNEIDDIMKGKNFPVIQKSNISMTVTVIPAVNSNRR